VRADVALLDEMAINKYWSCRVGAGFEIFPDILDDRIDGEWLVAGGRYGVRRMFNRVRFPEPISILVITGTYTGSNPKVHVVL
jgi:hypothetical protein